MATPCPARAEKHPCGLLKVLRASSLVVRVENEKVFFQVIPYVSLLEGAMHPSMDVLMVGSHQEYVGAGQSEQGVDRMILNFTIPEVAAWH